MIAMLTEYLAGALILVGAAFTLVAAVGVIRLPDFYSRMHAASKAGTVGSGVLLIALALYIGDASVALRALAGVVFFLLTAPISAHLLSRAARLDGLPLWSGSVIDEMRIDGRRPARGERHPSD